MKKYLLLSLYLSIILLNTIQAQPIRTGKDYAIFFYITHFQNSNWSNLPETAQEVQAIASELRNNYGFEVELVANPTRQEILDKIDRVNNRKYLQDDQILFFFSTHGHYDEQQDEGFLIPTDGKYQDKYGDSWISYANLGRRITSNGAEHVLLALDACYSGAFGIRNKSRPNAAPWEAGSDMDCYGKANRALRYNSRLYFSSGSKAERTPARSLFASRWLEALRNGEELGVVRSNDLSYYLNKIEFPQPEYGSFRNHDDGGDFVFVYKNACVPSEFTPTIPHNKQPSISREEPNFLNANISFMVRGTSKEELTHQLQNIKDGDCVNITTANNAIKIVPPEFDEIEENILVKGAYSKLVAIPAQYETVTTQKLAKEEVTVPKSFTPEWETVTQQILVKEEGKKLIMVPPQFKTTTETQLESEAFTEWQQVNQNCDGNASSIGLCKNSTKRSFKTISKYVMITPSSTKEVIIPAEYRTISYRKCRNCHRARKRGNEQMITYPAEYKTVTSRVLKVPATTREESVPAQYERLIQKKLKRNGRIEVIKSVSAFTIIGCN